jgi:hypothetical protein
LPIIDTISLKRPSSATERYMCWTGLIVGIFLGAGIGIVVAGILSAVKRREAEDHSSETPIDHALMDEVEEVPDELPPLPKPETYFDRYPHS